LAEKIHMFTSNQNLVAEDLRQITTVDEIDNFIEFAETILAAAKHLKIARVAIQTEVVPAEKMLELIQQANRNKRSRGVMLHPRAASVVAAPAAGGGSGGGFAPSRQQPVGILSQALSNAGRLLSSGGNDEDEDDDEEEVSST
jgi:hypothetical protein